jgi:ferrochelatase
MSKTGVLLVNLGTPDSYKVSDVRKYLRQFLLDGRVIDINPVARWILVNLIIAPFRAPRSARVYKKVWMAQGSPLLYYGLELEKLLQNSLGEQYDVKLAMRYQSPSIESRLQYFEKKHYKKMVVLPLFPQYASATTGSVHQEVMDMISKQWIIPDIRFISNYFDHPLFIDAFVANAQKYLFSEQFDYVLFSYHGLPERQLRKSDCTNTCLKKENCCAKLTESNYYCYRAQCIATTELIANKLGLSKDKYTTCFQSRLGSDPWIKPYAEDVIKTLPANGKKRVLTLVPSFVADCLETIEEVGMEYKEIFEHAGGERWQMVESLNLSPIWVNCLTDLLKVSE